MWLTFAPIPQYTAVFYGISVDQVDWFSIAYFVVSLLTGFLAIAILDIFGLRASVSQLGVEGAHGMFGLVSLRYWGLVACKGSLSLKKKIYVLGGT